MPNLLLTVILLLFIELAVLVKVASHLGVIASIVLLIAASAVGGAVLKRQGLSTLKRADWRMQRGELPAQEIQDGFLIAVGGLLFFIPGFVTDVLGLLCIIPLTRHWLARFVFKNTKMSGFNYTQSGNVYTQTDDSQRTIHIIEGEVVDKDKP